MHVRPADSQSGSHGPASEGKDENLQPVNKSAEESLTNGPQENDSKSPSERERQQADRRLERERLMLQHVSLRHSDESCTFSSRILCPDAVGWIDRSYTYTGIPDEMIDAVFFAGLHKQVPSGMMTLSSRGLDGVAYIWAELPSNSGGFADLGWQECGTMHFVDTMTLVVFKVDLPADMEIDIPVTAPWIGGVGFNMAPDHVSIEESEEVKSVRPESLLKRLFGRLAANPCDVLDDLITHYNPLDSLERRLLRGMHDAWTRRDLERSVALRSGAEAPSPYSYSWPDAEELTCVSLRAEDVLALFAEKKPRPAGAWSLHRALAGELPDKSALLVIFLRSGFIAFLGLCMFTILALLMFSSTNLAISAGMVSSAQGSRAAGAGSAITTRSLFELPRISHSDLRLVDDVVIMHKQATHVMRLSLVRRDSFGNVTLHGADGSIVRLTGSGSASWTAAKASEVKLMDTGDMRGLPSEINTALLRWGSLRAEVVLDG